MVNGPLDIAISVYDMICEGCPKEHECHTINADSELEETDWDAVSRCMGSKLGVVPEHLNALSKHRLSQPSHRGP